MFREFNFVLKFLRRFIDENNLVTKYQDLVTDVESLQLVSGEELTNTEEKVNKAKLDLIAIHLKINPLLWSPPQLSILKHIEADSVIGKVASERIIDAFNSSMGNPKTIIQRINQLINETNDLNNRIKQISQNLNLEKDKEEIPEGKQVFQLVFDNNSRFSNFWESKDRSKTWSNIFRAISDLTGENFEDIKVISWNSSSPELGVWITAGLSFTDALLTAFQIALELKSIKDSINKDIQDASELNIDKPTLKIVTKNIKTNILNVYKKEKTERIIELRKNHGTNSNRPGKDGDSFLGIALDTIVKELEDGVRAIDPNEVENSISDSEENVDTKTLGNLYKENQKLELRIKKLLEEETQKRLEARNLRMKSELIIDENKRPSISWSKSELIKFMKERGLDYSGTKKDILERYEKMFGSVEEKLVVEESVKEGDDESTKKDSSIA